jgi:hypothetical protein
VTSNFNDEAVNTVFSRVVSYAMQTGRFDNVNQHEPKNAPGNGLTCSIWMQRITPIAAGGLDVTSGVVLLQARIYTSFVQQPFDMIDPSVMAATTDFIGAMSGDFEFGGEADVRNVDLLGAYGPSLSGEAGYIEIDRRVLRVMTIAVPIVINDMWEQVA